MAPAGPSPILSAAVRPPGAGGWGFRAPLLQTGDVEKCIRSWYGKRGEWRQVDVGQLASGGKTETSVSCFPPWGPSAPPWDLVRNAEPQACPGLTNPNLLFKKMGLMLEKRWYPWPGEVSGPSWAHISGLPHSPITRQVGQVTEFWLSLLRGSPTGHRRGDKGRRGRGTELRPGRRKALHPTDNPGGTEAASRQGGGLQADPAPPMAWQQPVRPRDGGPGETRPRSPAQSNSETRQALC